MLNTLSLLFRVILQMVIKKWILWPLDWQHKFDSLGFLLVFFYQKMRKRMWQHIVKFSTKEIYTENDIYLFLTKITIFPHKDALSRRDVHLCLTANYLHLDMFDQNLKKVEFSVSRYFTCSVLVKFSALFGDHWLQCARRGRRKFRASRQASH